jgi:putative protease
MVIKNKQKINFIKPELLAPAGNLEKMKTAFAFGADAVYLGIPDFSLRVRINDFDMAEIKKAIKYAHRINKKVYITLNIFAHNEHIKKIPAHLKKLNEIKPDGIFISDPGILKLVKKYLPKIKIILSTQANCTNWLAAQYWQEQGFSRVILSREMSLAEVKEIRVKVPNLELESFVHGALCMAYSGRCFLSKYFDDRNANLGDCSQPCRRNFQIKNREEVYINEKSRPGQVLEIAEESHGTYILNSEDLCLIKKLPELMDCGLSAFKIEGRAKSVYYLANVVGAYRRAIDEVVANKIMKKENGKILNYLHKELEKKLMHRGYTEGFMFSQGKMAQNLDNSHNQSRWEFCGQVVSDNKTAGQPNNRILVKVHNTLKVGDEIEILKPAYDIMKMKIKKLIDAKKGQEIQEAHGGSGGQTVVFEVKEEVPEYSVVRRRLKY